MQELQQEKVGKTVELGAWGSDEKAASEGITTTDAAFADTHLYCSICWNSASLWSNSQE